MAIDNTTETEEWREVPGYPGYFVSNLGNLKHIVHLGGMVGKRGEVNIVLSDANNVRKRVLVHRLICEIFNGPQPSPIHKSVAHWDGNPSNNRADNLRWATHQENMMDKARHGRMRRGEQHAIAKLTEANVREIRRLIKTGVSQMALGEMFGVSQGAIYRIHAGQTWAWLK